MEWFGKAKEKQPFLIYKQGAQNLFIGDMENFDAEHVLKMAGLYSIWKDHESGVLFFLV